MLAGLGASRTHQYNFTLFLVAVVGLSLLTVGVFVLTASRAGIDSSAGAHTE